MSARLSRRERRLLFAYEDELGRRGKPLARPLAALARFVAWLSTRRHVTLAETRPQDLVAYRSVLAGLGLAPRSQAVRFGVVRDLFRFLYCRGYLRHDPGALVEQPRRSR